MADRDLEAVPGHAIGRVDVTLTISLALQALTRDHVRTTYLAVGRPAGSAPSA
jgi:hypothetical protein